MRPLSRRVLLIEDNPIVGSVMTDLLEALGHQARWASDGRNGLTAVAEFHPDLVLCDLDLPDVNGWLLLPTLRELAPGVPIVAHSAWTSVFDDEEGALSGFDGHLPKPFRMDALEDLLSRS